MTFTLSHASKLGTAIVLGTWLSSAAFAQANDPHAGHDMAMSGSSDQSASSVAYEQANAKMHKDMAVTLTGDADRDFLAGMIPHHQGAVDMAEVVLKYGKDPKVKKLAQDIVAAQKEEIAMMQAMLKENKAAK